MKHDLHVCADVNDLSRQTAEAVATAISNAVNRRGRCSIALSGGSTPRPMYRLLASEFTNRISWTDVHVFWGDERFVPPGDPQRNETMAREALLDHVPCPASNVHAVPGAATADEAAAQYEAMLRTHFGAEPRFDLVLLGLGADGHTASLFPHASALRERDRWVVAVTGPAAPPLRVTLTFAAFNHAALTFFMVAGTDKASALQHVFEGADPESYPAAGIRPPGGAVWWVDKAAAQAVQSHTRS